MTPAAGTCRLGRRGSQGVVVCSGRRVVARDAGRGELESLSTGCNATTRRSSVAELHLSAVGGDSV